MNDTTVDIKLRNVRLSDAAEIFALLYRLGLALRGDATPPTLAMTPPKDAEKPAAKQLATPPAPEPAPAKEEKPVTNGHTNGAAKPLVNPETIAAVAAGSPAKAPKEEKPKPAKAPKEEKPKDAEKLEAAPEPAPAAEKKSEQLFTEADNELPLQLADARKLRDVLVFLQNDKGLQDPEALAAECELLAKHPQAPGCLTRISGSILDRVKRVLESVDSGAALS